MMMTNIIMRRRRWNDIGVASGRQDRWPESLQRSDIMIVITVTLWFLDSGNQRDHKLVVEFWGGSGSSFTAEFCAKRSDLWLSRLCNMQTVFWSVFVPHLWVKPRLVHVMRCSSRSHVGLGGVADHLHVSPRVRMSRHPTFKSCDWDSRLPPVQVTVHNLVGILHFGPIVSTLEVLLVFEQDEVHCGHFLKGHDSALQTVVFHSCPKPATSKPVAPCEVLRVPCWVVKVNRPGAVLVHEVELIP